MNSELMFEMLAGGKDTTFILTGYGNLGMDSRIACAVRTVFAWRDFLFSKPTATREELGIYDAATRTREASRVNKSNYRLNLIA